MDNNETLRQDKNAGIMKVRFSIGAKLITIISIIVLVSLGSIIALVSWLVRQDLQVAAEANNFEINRRSAAEMESTLVNVRSYSRMLIQTITAVGTESAIARDSVDFFFEENPQIAAVFFTVGAQTNRNLINRRFFNSRGIDEELAGSYRDENIEVLMHAVEGKTELLNATPHLTISTIALFFPWRNGGAGVLFSPANLDDTFGFGANQSYLLNSAGDILLDADFDLIRTGINTANSNYTKSVWESTARNSQTLYTDEDGIRYFRAFTKLSIGGGIVITSIEYDKVFEGIAATTRRNIYLTAAVLFISIMMIWFFAKSISVPLKALASAALTIEGGAFEVNLQPKGGDETGVLTASFQRMCSALGIFGRFTNRDIAVQAMRGEIRPGGLPKHATVFFSDIRGFTEKSENFTKTFKDEASDRIVFWLNAYLTQMVECVEKTNGVVDKFIGDAVMAHWGTAYTSGSPQQDAYNCVSAALMMRSAINIMNASRKQDDPGDPPIQIGCGINTGIVTAGQIGSDLRMEYTVIGDPVNLASRIESLNKPLGTDILISEDTWNLVKDKFVTEEMPSVTVKGKEKPVRIFAVVNATGADNGPRNLTEVREILGTNAPDLSNVDVNASEQKYTIGES
ncbi:MAG: HAMP domain-containing protein [Treponema sp.]|jgi:adenylate cyclase|nr:HAMP domain-containing protein [Treponema sp.]